MSRRNCKRRFGETSAGNGNRAWGYSGGKSAATDNCISNVVFENVQISAPKWLTIGNADGVEFRNSKIFAADGAPVILENARVDNVETSAQK
jgi:hypothetical protein